MTKSPHKTSRFSRRRIVEKPAPSQQLPVLTGEVLPPLVKKNGRPFAIPGPEKDKATYAGVLKTLFGLGEIMATSKECAAVLGISEKTLFTFFQRHPEARDAWESGKEVGKQSLRRKQFKLAETNATMGIFLGLNYLDQKDLRGGGQPTSTQANAQVTIVQFGENEGKV